MSELTAFGMSYLASKGLDWAFSRIGTMVLQRCGEKRVANFLEAFLKEIDEAKKGKESLAKILDRYFASEESRETIFSAYRRVVFSASVKIGPRIIGLITAETMKHGAECYAEKICLAAEELTDEDFKGLDEFLRSENLSKKETQIRHSDSTSPLLTNCTLRDEWENWRVKLFRLGLYDEWSEFDIGYVRGDAFNQGEPGISMKQTSVIDFGSEVFLLMEYYHSVCGEQH